MKKILLLVAIIGLFGLATGCKPSTRVIFKPALVSIDPGEGWKRMDISPAPPACSPRLMSKVGMINALCLEDLTDLQKAADHLQTSFSATGKTLPDSFKQEEFTTDSGLKGIHLSYTAQSDMRSHSFITQNRKGQCVSISYITSPKVESSAILEAIRKTLSVE